MISSVVRLGLVCQVGLRSGWCVMEAVVGSQGKPTSLGTLPGPSTRLRPHEEISPVRYPIEFNAPETESRAQLLRHRTTGCSEVEPSPAV